MLNCYTPQVYLMTEVAYRDGYKTCPGSMTTRHSRVVATLFVSFVAELFAKEVC